MQSSANPIGSTYHSCFISYSHVDTVFASNLHDDLEAAGVDCWFAPCDMRIGARLQQTVFDAITTQSRLLVVISQHAITSGWVGFEVETAHALTLKGTKLPVIPIQIDKAVLPATIAWPQYVRLLQHIGDFTAWQNPLDYRAALDQLLIALKI